MKTVLPLAILSTEQAKKFLTLMYKNKEAYHPEDDAKDIINDEGERVFTDTEAVGLNHIMGQVWEINDFDPCKFLLDLIVRGNRNKEK